MKDATVETFATAGAPVAIRPACSRINIIDNTHAHHIKPTRPAPAIARAQEERVELGWEVTLLRHVDLGIDLTIRCIRGDFDGNKFDSLRPPELPFRPFLDSNFRNDEPAPGGECGLVILRPDRAELRAA